MFCCNLEIYFEKKKEKQTNKQKSILSSCYAMSCRDYPISSDQRSATAERLVTSLEKSNLVNIKYVQREALLLMLQAT